MLVFDTEPDASLDAFRDYSPPLSKWRMPSDGPRPAQTIIRIVAALAQDELGRVLLVRKKGTRVFMQPGGKLHDSEPHLVALERELGEELKCSVRPGSSVFLGTFAAPAANESNCLVEAALYGVELVGAISPASEIDEVAWADLYSSGEIELAPLTREKVLPLAARLFARRKQTSL